MSETRELAFIIADLSGYTALTEAHGDERAADVVTRYADLARSVLEPGARCVERVGDELLVTALDAATAARSALAIRDRIEREPLFPTIRAGVHAGPVVEREGRYFGATLNLTARIAGHARGGQILCSGTVATAVSTLADVAVRPLGEVRFKNVGSAVAVYELIAAHRDGAETLLDPVCRMRVSAEAAPARLPYGGAIYYFCSFDCAKAFAVAPQRYVSS